MAYATGEATGFTPPQYVFFPGQVVYRVPGSNAMVIDEQEREREEEELLLRV